MSYLNSPRKGCSRGMKICVWTHLGLIKWKTTKKMKKMEEDLKKMKNGRRPQKNKKMEDDLKKNKNQPNWL